MRPLLAVLVLATACTAAPESSASDLLTAERWSDVPNAPPLELASAQVATRVAYPNLQTTVLKGVVRGSTAPGAQVTVHYRLRIGDAVVRDWTTQAATPAGDGVWEFATPSYQEPCPHYCPRHVYQLAVAHTANGQTVWDNGGGFGLDHVLASDIGGSVPVYAGPPALLDGPVELAYVAWDATSRQARGQLVLANLAYAKEVALVYSTDGWQTVHEAAAAFDRSSWDDLEYWAFSVAVEPGAGDLRFAVRYRAAGQTYWDNNLGRNYQVSTGAADLTLPPM